MSRTLRNQSNLISLTITGFFAILLGGCTPPSVPWDGAEVSLPKINVKNIVEEQETTAYEWDTINTRPRRPFPDNPIDVDGSLWNGEAAWGNLFRTDKGQFIGDTIQIRNVAQLITKGAGTSALEQEVSSIQNSIEEITAEVVEILPNGNLSVLARRIDYKEGNSIRFVTTITGVAKPSDVSESNQLDASKMLKAEIKTTKAYKLSDIDKLRQQELQKILQELEAERMAEQRARQSRAARAAAKDTTPSTN